MKVAGISVICLATSELECVSEVAFSCAEAACSRREAADCPFENGSAEESCCAEPDRCGSQSPPAVAKQRRKRRKKRASADAAASEAINPRRSRRHEAQRRRRQEEHQARCAAVRYASDAGARKVSQQEIAGRLGVAPRTLRHWRGQQAIGELAPDWRGRPVLCCPVPERNDVIRFLVNVTGPSIGLPALRAMFKMRRAVLEDLLVRYRRAWRRRYRRNGYRLTWHHPGRVWAMDFTEPGQPIDGVFPYLFAVRDLASHRQLAWQPVRGQAADDTRPVLSSLYAEHGAPLVMKSDNGSAFIAETTGQRMEEAGVAQLFSPPAHPQYNGQLERSNGVLKTYTDLHAVAEGHPFRLDSEDVAHGLHLANTVSRPWGHEGPSPEEAWQAREAISQEERRHFQACLAAHRTQAAVDLGLDPTADLDHADRARWDRLALERTVEELGYLTKKPVVRAPKKPKRPSKKKLAKHVGTQRKAVATAPDAAPADSPPAQVPARREDISRETASELLAARERCDTIETAAESIAAASDLSQAVTPAHGERAFPSWLRRLFTPLLSIGKAAKFSR